MPKTRSIKVISADEPWMIVKIADGTTIKFRTIVMGALQLLHDNGEPIVNEDGTGQYGLQCQQVQIIESSPMIEERQVTNNNERKN
jgi:hypothetical protein